MKNRLLPGLAALACIGLAALPAQADVVTDWNIRAGNILFEARAGTPPANRVMAIVQTAVHEAVRDAGKEASLDAAVAAANCRSLLALVPSQAEAIDRACQAAMALIPDGPTKDAGIAAGEKAAADVLARRADDGANAPEAYRPHTTPGAYVPTTIPVLSQWSQRKTWLLTSASQLRPGPPPALDSAAWARDYNEVKTLGAKNGSTRTQEQTDIARFWEATMPVIYYGVVRSVANQDGRSPLQNARLFAAVTQAMDDALVAVFDAKYAYGFWRPITAIRNGDTDGNDATARDATWLPFIETPMHPEYPCAHCIIAASVGTVIKAEVGDGPMPTLSTSSYTANGATRSWPTVEAFVDEVSFARILDGVHYRNSTEVGAAMGREIGALAAKKHFGAR